MGRAVVSGLPSRQQVVAQLVLAFLAAAKQALADMVLALELVADTAQVPVRAHQLAATMERKALLASTLCSVVVQERALGLAQPLMVLALVQASEPFLVQALG